MNKIEKIVKDYQDFHKVPIIRTFEKLSIAKDIFSAKELFYKIWSEIDKTNSFKDLPEYSKIYEWMVDNKGKGLFLFGDKGRGKTNIISHVLPILFYLNKNAVLRPKRAIDISLDNLEKIKKSKYVVIDEIGVEPKLSNFGEPFEAISNIVDDCESKTKLFFGNTNLTAEEMHNRYGDRFIDRIQRLCKLIEFKGDSLR